MPTQTLSNAVVDPQDPGTGISDYDPNAAAIQALARSHEQGEYVGDGLQFANVDTTNDQVDLTAGYCYILDDSASTAGSRSSGGQPQTMSTASTGYDTEIPSEIPYVVVVPSDVVDVPLEAGVNDVYISVDPSAQNAVTLHYGTAISAPTEPSLYLGTVDTSDASTTSGDSGRSQSMEDLTANNSITDPAGTSHTGELADLADVSEYTDEDAQDAFDALLSAGDKLSYTYDDANDTLTINTSALDTEEVEDAVASLMASSGNLAWNYDDANGVLTISLSGPIEGVQIGSDTNRSPGYFSTLSADQATIGSGDTINQAEFGTVSIDIGASSDNDFTNTVDATNSVAFSTAFDSTPAVLTGLITNQSRGIQDYVTNLSTTAVDVKLQNASNGDPDPIDVSWWAIQ